jgi:hypothetical protein
MHIETGNAYWRLRADVVSTVLSDGGVILDLRTKFFFSANLTALAVVQMFEDGTTRDRVLEAAQKWGANGDIPAVKQLIEQIITEGLAEPATPVPGSPPEVTVTTWMSPVLSKHTEPLQRIMVSAFDPGMPLAE